MGVYDICDAYCPTCKKTTKHDSGWESEVPNSVEMTCKECNVFRYVHL